MNNLDRTLKFCISLSTGLIVFIILETLIFNHSIIPSIVGFIVTLAMLYKTGYLTEKSGEK